MEDLQANKRHAYKRTWEQHGAGPRALQWNGYASAANRYRNLITPDLALEGRSILDVGCGFGDIIPYIVAATDTFEYLGVDTMPEFLAEARTRYAGYQFLEQDYFADSLDQQFDVIICCGALNTNVPDVKEFREKAITTMFSHAKQAVAFNMSGGKNLENEPAKQVHYADPMEILKFCLTLSPKVILRQHYSLKDFTIVIYT